ncbi:MAG: ATP phosphoribosyltransferase regulatory subunit, partial [Rhodoplanes sp.]
ELHDPHSRADGQLVAGGRYDGLFARLGCAEPIPAVGLSVWIERLTALGGGR